MHLCADVCRSNDFQSAQHEQLSQVYTRAIRTLAEEENFLWFINSADWPVDMHTHRDNLVRGTGLDEEVTENNENYAIVLPPLVDSFWRLFLTLADEDERHVMGPAIEQHKKDSVERSRTLNNHTMEDDSSVREGFKKKVHSIDEACEGTEDYRNSLSSDGADKAEKEIKKLERAENKFSNMSWQANLNEI